MKCLIFAVCALLVGACTTFRPVDPPANHGQTAAWGDVLQVGDRVMVTMRDASIRQFRITQVTDTSLDGDGISLPFADIVRVDIRKFSALRMGSTVIGVIGAVVVALLLTHDTGSDSAGVCVKFCP